MSLSFATNFVATASVLPLAQSASGLAVRVATQASGTLGIITVSGFASTPVWTLSSATPSWVNLSTNTAGNVCTFTLTGAQYQQSPYAFFATCTDGVNSSSFPFFMEVRNPLSLAANTSNPVVANSTTLSIPSYDSSVEDIVIQGLGLFGVVQPSCDFIPPSSLPAGLNYVTSDGSQAVLRVSEPHFQSDGPFISTDLTGGLQLFTTSPTAVPLTIQGYEAGAFYDEQDRYSPLTLTVSSQTQQAGVLDFAIGAYYNTNTNFLQLDAQIDSLLGNLQSAGTAVALPLQYAWSAGGTAELTLNSGGGTKSVTYTIDSPGTASITLQVQDANDNAIATKTVSFNAVAESGISWLSTAAIKVGVAGVSPSSGNDVIFGNTAQTVEVELSSPDGFNSSEIITLTLSVDTTASSIEFALPVPTLTNPGPIVLNSTSPTATVGFNFPTGAAIGNRWLLKISASNGGSRSGYAQVVIECTGLPILTVTGVPTTISSSTGTAIAPIQLGATESGTSVPSATFELIGGSEFGSNVFGAPDGLYINDLNQIVGNATAAGTYQFVVAANASGYRRGYSSIVTLSVATVATPLQITSFASSVNAIADNTQFTVSWSTSGSITNLFLAQIPSANQVTTVTGSNSYGTTQVGSEVYSLYGTSYYGTSYSVPLVVISSSSSSSGQLPPSPTIAVIDEDYNLTVNWQPQSFVVGDLAPYAIYSGWDIVLQTPPATGTPLTIFTDGGLSEGTGTVSARVFTDQLVSGDYAMNMTAISSNLTQALNSNPWDSSHTFPASLQDVDVTLSNTNLLLGQTLTITLNSAYAANVNGVPCTWQVVFPDNTSTGWLPLSSRSVAKSFSISGALNVIVQTQNSFSTNDPPVNLRRQLTQQIYVVNQQYNPTAAAENSLTGTLGIGGEAGFEIVNASTSEVTPQPYEVVVRSIARDTITNELKLMIATSRFSNASSILGTMAIDVFPMMGRPHAKELITPIYILETTAASSISPVQITTSNLPSNSYIGLPMAEFDMQATGGTPSYSWYAEGLPPGLKMSIDGTISGTPIEMGTFTVNFACMDSSSPAYIAETALTFVIPTNLTIVTTGALPVAVVGTMYDSGGVISNTGGLAPYTWSIVAGSVPIGITINASDGVLSGIPCTYNSTTDFYAVSGNLFNFTVQVTDAVGAIVSANYSIQLAAAALSLGLLNQPTVVAGAQSKISVPVYGGQSPYTLTNFVDNTGVIGSGLAVASPSSVSFVSGITPTTLEILNTNETLYPVSYPYTVAITLEAAGGVPFNIGLLDTQSYKFLVTASTMPGAACYGALLVGSPTGDGTYLVTVEVIDSVGTTATKTLTIATQQQGVGEYTIVPGVLNTNGSANPSQWAWPPTPLTGLPDPVLNQAYVPTGGANWYYCMVLFNNGVAQLNNGASTASPPVYNTPVAASIVGGALPVGIAYESANDKFSITGADCVILIDNLSVPTVAGGENFELQISGIINSSSVVVSTAQWFSLDVGGSNTAQGSGGTPVVSIVYSDEIDLNLSTLAPDAIGSYSWVYPLIAVGGAPPYSFAIQTGTTLPGYVPVAIGSLPGFSSATTAVNSPASTNYDVLVIATDSQGVQSAVTDLPIRILASATSPVYILSNNFPASLYVNREIPSDTYYVESDLLSNWEASGLPLGVTLSSATGTFAYLQGTPTTVTAGTSVTVAATSALYGTTASIPFNLAVLAQGATISAPPTAVIGTLYRVVTNNSIVSATYTGFQPTDANLPLLQNNPSLATLGAQGTTIGGLPTTGITDVTADGFVMSYDYIPLTAGQDTLSFNSTSPPHEAFPATQVVTEVYPALAAVGATVPYSVSEYVTGLTMQPPVQTPTGGAPPYSIYIVSTSDPRFTFTPNLANSLISIEVSQFTAQTTPYVCNVTMQVVDSASNSVIVAGQLSVTVVAQTTITVLFSDYTWDIDLSDLQSEEPVVGSVVLESPTSGAMAIGQLGHLPFTYNVSSVTIPTGLGSFIQSSPSGRVLAFYLSENSSSAPVSDVNGFLSPSTNFNVTPTTYSTALALTGTYSISVTLQVIDNQGITQSANQTVNVVISG